MKNKYSVLILVVAVAVNSSNGYSIKEPGSYTASFSGASSSSSAYSHSSSGSYSFNGNVNPNDVEALKAAAVAGASAGAVAGAGAGVGTTAGAIAGAGAVANSASLAGSGSYAGSGAIAGANNGVLAGTNSGSGATSGSFGSSGCSGGNDCGTGETSNAINGESSVPEDNGSYKVIGQDKYTTGYTSGAKTNYAVGGQYVQGAQNSGCISCKGPFPGPSGSIHDYKLVSQVPAVPHTGNAPVAQPVQPSAGSSGAHASAGSGTFNSYQPSVSINNLPGSSGSIHNSKPATGHVAPSGTNYATGSGSGHVSPSLIATLPGPSGSIYDSKPASAGAGAVAGASAGSGSYYTGSGSHPNIAPSHPVVVPAPQIVPEQPIGAGPGLSGIIAALPGPSGSIYNSKPAHGTGGAVSGAGAVAGASAGADSYYTGSGSHSNIAPSHPVAVPATHVVSEKPIGAGPGLPGIIAVLPGPSGSIHDSKPVNVVPHVHGAGAGVVGGGATTGSHSGAGSVSNIPSLHPVVGPACSYTPGSSNNCGTPVVQHGGQSNSAAGANANAAAGANSATQPGAGGCVNCKGPFPGPNGSIHTYKPAPSVSSAGFHSGGNTNGIVSGSSFSIGGGGASSGTYNGAGSFTNIPSSHPVVGPACSYTPGSPNKCGAGANANAAASANSADQAGVLQPSIHPQLPSSGTYFINKPALPSIDFEPPTASYGPSFSGQIPCTDSSCGSIPKSPEYPTLIPANCGSGSSCLGQTGPTASGAYSGSKSSAGSDSILVNKEDNSQYQGLNHDNAHLSGAIVYENDDGSYHNIPKPSKPIYKNAEKGGYAVSSDNSDNAGFLIGPGTGHLPIEGDAEFKPFGTQGALGGSAAFTKGAADKNDKPFGTQGAFGGSAASTKGATENNDKAFGTQGAFGGSAAFASGAAERSDKPFGTQGAFGGSAAFSKSSAGAHSSETQSISGNGNGFATGDVIIQKADGILISPISDGSDKPTCPSGGCGSANNIFVGSGSGIASGSGSGSGQLEFLDNHAGTPVKLECSGASCGDTEVFVIQEKPSKPGSYGSYSGTGSGANAAGYATGQVLVNQGVNAYDVTNSGSNGNSIGGSFSDSQGGAYAGSSQYGSSGCSTGRCGGQGFAVGGSLGIPSPGGFLDKLFGAGGLSGTVINRFGGSGYGGSAAYSNAGSYSGASAGGFASAGASASAHSGSFAHSF